MLVIRVFLFAVSLSINLATISRAESSECARISDLASARARWAAIRGWMLLIGAALCIALPAWWLCWAVRRMPTSPTKNVNCR